MSAIFGVLRRDGAPVAPDNLVTMRRALAHWGPDGVELWHDGCAGLGQALFCSTAESRCERLPSVDTEQGFAFTASARVDNRADLLRQLPFGEPSFQVSDGAIVRCAYRTWGAACVERIFGDWAFAAWHPADRRLFLARDHFGNTGLYYYADPRVFAFASDRQALLDLKLAPISLDELYLAQVLTSWPAYHGERTIHRPLRRLPPAHTATVTPDRLDVRQYWFLEDTPELHLPRREDYVEAFQAVVDDAVRARLRAPDGNTPLATTLSGGLDSSSLTVTAAAMLRSEGQRLAAFTAVPLLDTTAYVGERFGDEWPLAQATAQFAGNVDLQPVQATGITPIEGIRRALQIHNEPAHGAGNHYWILDLLRAVRESGHRVLLTGQVGNAAFSWPGSPCSWPLVDQLRELGWRKWARTCVVPCLPRGLMRRVQRLRRGQGQAWLRGSALRADVAARLGLWARRLDDPASLPPRTPLEARGFLMPGRSFVGAQWAQMGAAARLEVRDPTGDARVLAFSYSVPDHVFRDSAARLDRWLIRAAMAGRLPDPVRLNRRRGRQAGDLVPRLRACAVEVETALTEIARGPAAAYLDAPAMRRAWHMIQTQDTPEAFRSAITVLTRGIGGGLFVNKFLSS